MSMPAPQPGQPLPGQPLPAGPNAAGPLGGQPWQPGAPTPPGAPISPGSPTPPSAPAWTGIAALGSVLALLAIILPWFHPSLNGAEIPGSGEIRAWQGGRISLAGPVILVLVGIAWIRELARPAGGAMKAATYSIVAGAAGLVTAVLGWMLAPKAYSDWDETKEMAEGLGMELTIGPQIGFWLLVAASVVVLVVGVAAAVRLKRR